MLTIDGLCKSFGDVPALADVSLTLGKGEIISLLGPSGCGKSTLLKLVAGLEQPNRGTIYWAGESLAGVPTYRRNFGLMFQDYALFPHRNVLQNVAFGLQQQRLPRQEVARRAGEMLARVGMAGYASRSVLTLSGGEQQRVALARALAPRPRLLMLDEPLGALDRTLRDALLAELEALLRELEQTVIYVTHDQSEAFAISDRTLVMRAGRVMQAGSPAELYRQPNSRFVAEFLGLTNILPATVIDGQTIGLPWGELMWPAGDLGSLGEQFTLLIRPEAALANPDDLAAITGVVERALFQGATYRVMIRPDKGPALGFDLGLAAAPELGGEISVRPAHLSRLAG